MKQNFFVAYTGWGYAAGIFYNKVRFFDAFQEISRNTAAVSGIIHFEKSASSSQNLYIRCAWLLFWIVNGLCDRETDTKSNRNHIYPSVDAF